MFFQSVSFYQEVLEVFNIFKFDLNDETAEKVQLLLAHPEPQNSAFLAMFKEIFNELVKKGDQKLLIRFFKEAIHPEADIYCTGERINSWYVANKT